MDEQTKLRQWAIEQAIAMHGPVGRTFEVIQGEAAKILAFVNGEESGSKYDKPKGD